MFFIIQDSSRYYLSVCRLFVGKTSRARATEISAGYVDDFHLKFIRGTSKDGAARGEIHNLVTLPSRVSSVAVFPTFPDVSSRSCDQELSAGNLSRACHGIRVQGSKGNGSPPSLPLCIVGKRWKTLASSGIPALPRYKISPRVSHWSPPEEMRWFLPPSPGPR